MSESEKKQVADFIKRGLAVYDTPQWHGRFLLANWPSLAALAWHGWQTVGRGAVVVNFPDAYDPGESQPYYCLPVRYDEPRQILNSDDGPQLVDQSVETISQWLERYEPEKEFIAGVEKLDGMSSYRLCEMIDGITPTPEESYRMHVDDGHPLPEWIYAMVIDAKLMAEESDSESFA